MKRQKKSKKGFTLVEVILAVAILVLALSGILGAFFSCFVLISTSKNVNLATDAAMSIVEQIRNTPFSQITSMSFSVGGQTYDPVEDGDIYSWSFPIPEVPSSMCKVYVDEANPELLEARVSVCWRQGKRVFGEDNNLNGILDPGEDAAGGTIGMIDSPVELVTRIANR